MPRVPKVAPVEPPLEKGRRTMPIIVVLSTLLVVAVLIAGYFYYQYRKSPEVANAQELKDLQKTIGSLMLLPADEEPTLATVADKEKLVDQPFFQKAENGDKVLIYTNSGRAILYRPSAKKIVDVTTVNVSTPPTQTTTVPEVVPPVTQSPAEAPIPVIVRVALYNGSTTVGVTGIVENQLKQVASNIAVVTKENAKKNDYKKIIVVDVTGNNTDIAGKIAVTLGGTVSTLPDGEVAPSDADIAVIIGKE